MGWICSCSCSDLACSGRCGNLFHRFCNRSIFSVCYEQDHVLKTSSRIGIGKCVKDVQCLFFKMVHLLGRIANTSGCLYLLHDPVYLDFVLTVVFDNVNDLSSSRRIAVIERVDKW